MITRISIGLATFGICFAVIRAIAIFLTKKYFNTQKLIQDLIVSLPEKSGFKYVFGFRENIHDIIYDRGSNTVSLKYTVPSTICSHDAAPDCNSSESRPSCFHLGDVIALADELTSIVLGAADKSHRFGVSVQLSGECSGDVNAVPISPGAILQIVIRVIKIGRCLATLDMDVCALTKNDTYEKYFSIRHIKYVEMGLMWNIFGELLPFFLYCSKKSGAIDRAPTNLEKLLSLTANPSDANVSSAALVVQHKVLGEKLEEVDVSHYCMHVHQHVENFFGSMHGGALSCAFQCVAFEFCSKLSSTSMKQDVVTHYFLSSMEINYLRPSKKYLKFTVTITSTSSLDKRHECSSLMQLNISCYTSKHSGAAGRLSASAVCKIIDRTYVGDNASRASRG